MTIKQISIFIENKSGGLRDVTDVLAAAGVNIRALSIAETADFGILRLIVDDVFAAGNALKENNVVYSLTDVLAVAGDDKPGSISKIIAVLADAGISMNYAYAFFARSQDTAYLVVRVEDNRKAASVLEAAGIKVVSEDEIRRI